MRPGILILILTLPAAFAAASEELPQATLASQTLNPGIEAPRSGSFDFRQGRDWQKYLLGTPPARVLLQPEPRRLRADAGSCYTMRILPVQPDIDPAMVMKAPNDYDPRMVLKTPPACEQSAAKAPSEDGKFLLRKP